jgi:hypothetical protein
MVQGGDPVLSDLDHATDAMSQHGLGPVGTHSPRNALFDGLVRSRNDRRWNSQLGAFAKPNLVGGSSGSVVQMVTNVPTRVAPASAAPEPHSKETARRLGVLER